MEKFALVRTDPTTILSLVISIGVLYPAPSRSAYHASSTAGWVSGLLSRILGLSNEGSPMVRIQSGGDTPNNSHGSVFHFWHGSQRGLAIAEHRDRLP